jgi:transcriptional regulator with XRE-family HTH domain
MDQQTTGEPPRFRIVEHNGKEMKVPIPTKKDLAKSLEMRQKLNPAPQRKKDLSGERKRLIEDTAERIKGTLFNEEVAYSELARSMGLSKGHISHMLSGTRNMTLATLADIGEAIGYRFTVIPHKIDESDQDV